MKEIGVAELSKVGSPCLRDEIFIFLVNGLFSASMLATDVSEIVQRMCVQYVQEWLENK